MKTFLIQRFPTLLLYLGASLLLGLAVAFYGSIDRTPFPKPTSFWEAVNRVQNRILAEGNQDLEKWEGNEGPFSYEVRPLPKSEPGERKFLLKIRSPEIRPASMAWLPDTWVVGLVMTEREELPPIVSVVGFREIEEEEVK